MGLSNYIPSSRISQAGVIPNAAARPASPYAGQVIYQSDTDSILVWNGSGWYPNWNTAWGLIIFSEYGTGYSPAGNPATINSITFSHVAGRRVEIKAFGRINFSGSTNTAMELRDGTTRLAYWDEPVSTYWAGSISRIVASSSSSKTYDVRLHQAATQTLNVADFFALCAYDLGPA